MDRADFSSARAAVHNPQGPEHRGREAGKDNQADKREYGEGRGGGGKDRAYCEDDRKDNGERTRRDKKSARNKNKRINIKDMTIRDMI